MFAQIHNNLYYYVLQKGQFSDFRLDQKACMVTGICHIYGKWKAMTLYIRHKLGFRVEEAYLAIVNKLLSDVTLPTQPQIKFDGGWERSYRPTQPQIKLGQVQQISYTTTAALAVTVTLSIKLKL